MCRAQLSKGEGAEQEPRTGVMPPQKRSYRQKAFRQGDRFELAVTKKCQFFRQLLQRFLHAHLALAHHRAGSTHVV